MAMAHWERSTRDRVVALIEDGGCSIREAGRRCGVSYTTAARWWRNYLDRGSTERAPGTGRKRVSSQQEDRELVSTSRQNPFLNAKQLRRVTNFPGSSDTIRRRLREAGLYARRSAVKQELSEDNIAYRLAFAELHLRASWENVIFTDEKVFSTSSDGPRVVYRPRGTRHRQEYITTTRRSGRISISCWGWISARGAGILHRIEGILDSRQYAHILENVMLPSVQMLYGEEDFILQEDHSPVHKSAFVQQRLSTIGVNVMDWPPRAADMNPMENMWAEVARTLSENWPQNQPATPDALWDCVLEAWEEVAASGSYVRRLIESMPRRMKEVKNNEGFWIKY